MFIHEKPAHNLLLSFKEMHYIKKFHCDDPLLYISKYYRLQKNISKEIKEDNIKMVKELNELLNYAELHHNMILLSILFHSHIHFQADLVYKNYQKVIMTDNQILFLMSKLNRNKMIAEGLKFHHYFIDTLPFCVDPEQKTEDIFDLITHFQLMMLQRIWNRGRIDFRKEFLNIENDDFSEYGVDIKNYDINVQDYFINQEELNEYLR